MNPSTGLDFFPSFDVATVVVVVVVLLLDSRNHRYHGRRGGRTG